MRIKVSTGLLARIISAVYAVWIRTIRVRVSGVEGLAGLKGEGRRIVYAVWHDEFFPLVAQRTLLPNPDIQVVVSQSRDGELIALILERWGFGTCRGSSSRGGVRALISACRTMKKDGTDTVLLVDGPKGPRHEVKDGAIFLAWKAGAAIVPIRIRNSRAKVFAKAWDRFQLPLPFSATRIDYGRPYLLSLEPGQELDEAALEREKGVLADRLNEPLS
jgi:lysophospholipid acyltransferase (LPLAT)-like uncharacterized protein